MKTTIDPGNEGAAASLPGSVCRCWRLALDLDAVDVALAALGPRRLMLLARFEDQTTADDPPDSPVRGVSDRVAWVLRDAIEDRVRREAAAGRHWSEVRLLGIPALELRWAAESLRKRSAA